MEKHYLYRRFAIVVQAEEVTRPSQTQWKTLDPPIKESSSFLFLPGNKGVLQRRLPCITCPWPCRSFDLQNYKHWVVTPTHSLYPQIFSLDAHVQVCMFLLTAPPGMYILIGTRLESQSIAKTLILETSSILILFQRLNR